MNRISGCQALLPTMAFRSFANGSKGPRLTRLRHWTKLSPVLEFHNGRKKTNNYAGNCCGGCDPWSRYFSLDRHPVFADSGIAIFLGAGAKAHGGIYWAYSVRQLRPQGP